MWRRLQRDCENGVDASCVFQLTSGTLKSPIKSILELCGRESMYCNIEECSVSVDEGGMYIHVSCVIGCSCNSILISSSVGCTVISFDGILSETAIKTPPPLDPRSLRYIT